VTVPALSFLPSQAVDIRNADAPWYWLGLSGNGEFEGIRAILYDFRGNALNNDAHIASNPTAKGVWISTLAGYGGEPIPNDPPLMWPEGTRVMVDLQNVMGADIDVTLLYWGVKRYPAGGAAPCR
jgi:hypothetical protein